MKDDYGECSLCKKGRFLLKEKKKLAGTDYNVLKCDKCGYCVAKRND